MSITLSEEIHELIIRSVVPKISHYMKLEHNIDVDLDNLSNFLGAQTSLSGHAKSLLDKCAHISNKGKLCTRKAVNGKFYCSNHSDKDKLKNPNKKPYKKDFEKSILKDDCLKSNQFPCRYFHNSNQNIIINHEHSLIIYLNEENKYVIIGIYEPPENSNEEDVLSKKLQYIRELTSSEIEKFQDSFKLSYKYKEYINVIKDFAFNFENKIVKETEHKKRGRKPKNSNIEKLFQEHFDQEHKEIENTVKNISSKTKKTNVTPIINFVD